MTLRVIQAGIQTTVQAAPYSGLRGEGMPSAGPADRLSAAIANRLCGNPAGTALLEITLGGFALEARVPVTIAIAGGDCEAQHNNIALSRNRPILLNAGDRLTLGTSIQGCRTYIGFGGGLIDQAGNPLESTYLPAKIGGLDGRNLANGDLLSVHKTAHGTAIASQHSSIPKPSLSRDYLLRYCKGPEAELCTTNLEKVRFNVSSRNSRMGIQLQAGQPLKLTSSKIRSSAVLSGSIQCPPDGNPFILGVDAQTTGGYPRLAQVIRADQHLIGQLRSGDTVRFVRVPIDRAQAIYREKLGLWRQHVPDLAAL